MPQLIWSLTAAPRFKIGDRICREYKVTAVVREGKITQEVHAKKKNDTSKKVIRIVTRARVREIDVTKEVEWLKDTCSFRAEFSRFVVQHVDSIYSYTVFEKCQRTLKEVISDAEIHISKRHVIEIATQIIGAVQHLNNHSIFNIDTSPENFEVVDEDTEEIYYNYDTRGYSSRRVLKSTKIRLAYYGSVGSNPSRITCGDQYKSPEHVYDFPLTSSSNVFSVGCVVAELLLRKPLFPVCVPGRLYPREKAVIFDTMLGPFPDSLVHDIRRFFKGVFKYDNSDFPEFEGVSHVVREFCEQAEPLKYTILEELSSDVVECMTRLDLNRRVPLADILHHPFFDVSPL